MVSRLVKAVALFIVVGGLTLPLTSHAQQQGVSHATFARDIALRLALDCHVDDPSEMIFGLLDAEGLSPKDGWKKNKILTVGDFARVIVLVMERNSGEPKVTGDDNAFIEAAKAAGYNLESIEETLMDMKTLENKTGPAANRKNTTTDPQKVGHLFGEPDERVGGADASFTTTSILDRLAQTPVTPAPQTPVTPAPTTTSGGGSSAAAAIVAPSTVARAIRSLPGATAPPPDIYKVN